MVNVDAYGGIPPIDLRGEKLIGDGGFLSTRHWRAVSSRIPRVLVSLVDYCGGALM